MVFVCILFLSLAIGLQFGQCAENKDVQFVGTNDKCGDFCSKSFQSKDEAIKSCQQGCRLYSVIELIGKPRGEGFPANNATAVTLSCRDTCNKAYNDSVLKVACQSGCDNQVPFTAGSAAITVDDSSPTFPFVSDLVTNAFGSLDGVQSRMMENFNKLKNWFKDSDQFQLPDVNFDSTSSQDSIENFFGRLENKAKDLFNQLQPDQQRRLDGASTVNPLYAYAKNLQQGNQPASSNAFKPDDDLNRDYFDPNPIFSVKIVSGDFDSDSDMEDDMDGALHQFESSEDNDRNKIWFSFTPSWDGKLLLPPPPATGDGHRHETYIDSDDTWLACLARRTQNLSQVTRWLLFVSMMLSMLCVIYLCLTVIRSNKQRRRRLRLQADSERPDSTYWMAPPTYEKLGMPPAYNEKGSDRKSPPPAYETAISPPTK